MHRYDLAWPAHLNCALFPEQQDNALCIDRNGTQQHQQSATPSASPAAPPSTKEESFSKDMDRRLSTLLETGLNGASLKCSCGCREPLVQTSSTKASVAGIPGCSEPCRSKNTRRFTEFWMAFCGLLCAASSLFTFCTFLIDTSRFPYPERPLVYFALCYFFLSIGFIVRLVLGHEQVACNASTVVHGVASSPTCTVVFLFIYFFSSASSIWWLLLCAVWALSSCLKWSSEAISKYSHTGLVLILDAMEGDSMTGLCRIEQNVDQFTLGFVLVPQLVYLVLGSISLLVGFMSIFKVQRSIKIQDAHSNGLQATADKLANLMNRMAVLSALFIVSMSVYLGIVNWEMKNRELIQIGQVCTCNWISENDGSLMKPFDATKQDYVVVMLKLLVLVLPGIGCSFWVCSSKTWRTWKKVLRRCCCCCTADDKAKSSSLASQNAFWTMKQTSEAASAALPLPPLPADKLRADFYHTPTFEEMRYMPSAVGLSQTGYCHITPNLMAPGSLSSTTSTRASPPSASNYSKVSNYRHFPQ
ncbi:Frizzled-8 [Cichlidogyrus casuarinus]|uniref:Frizzled-8 n=1 Tax=Cichlidogyrus casuarinus TaxID=1844966 RepID=A0ABD2Q4T7_9PLAT